MIDYIAKGKSINIEKNESVEVEENISLPNPRISEIETRKQEIQERFNYIDLQRKHWIDKVTENNVLICDDNQWEVYRLEKQTLLDEWHLLKQELIDLNV